MKNFRSILVICLLLAVGLCSCAGQPGDVNSVQSASVPQVTESPVPAGPLIALVLNGENSFNQSFAEAAQPLMEAGGYGVTKSYSKDADGQIDDMYRAIGNGAKCICVLPYDMDKLQQVIEECDAQDIPVVNLMVPINGVVAMLISPDYKDMGALALQAAISAQPDGAVVSTVESKELPFVTQLVHDGFADAAQEEEKAELAASILVESATEEAYSSTKQMLTEHEAINVVFVLDEMLVADVVRAAEESGRQLTILAIGGSEEMMRLISEGRVFASVFASPLQLAQLAASYAMEAASGVQIPQYAQLKLETITKDTVAHYLEKGSYADILTPPTPSPVPTSTPSPEPQQTEAAEEEPSEQTQVAESQSPQPA